jgi:hypothetical protein
MLDRWNAHDIEGYVEVYCKSPDLLVVVDAEQFNGWQQLHDSYLNGYPDRNAIIRSTQTHSSQVVETGSRTPAYLVVGRFPKFQAGLSRRRESDPGFGGLLSEDGGKQHHEPPKV